MRRALLALCFSLLGCPKTEKAGHLSVPQTDTIRWSSGTRNEARVELGRILFFEPRLSQNGQMSCATCHNPAKGFSDGREKAVGVHGDALPRHTPSLYNLAWSPTFFWDGRVTSLEEQAKGPLTNAHEMDMTEALIVERLSAVPGYPPLFSAAFGEGPVTLHKVTQAIADFERTIVVANTPLDRYLAGDKAALSPAAQAGLEIFLHKGDCAQCHFGPNLTDGQFHNTGVANSEDLGRHELDLVGDFHESPYAFLNTFRSFKTPGLRNVSLSAPYMHNGSVPTLEDVVEFYNEGGRHADLTGRSRNVHPLALTAEEKAQLVAFLEALTGPYEVAIPPLP